MIMPKYNLEFNLNEYIRQVEPDKIDKSNAWQNGIHEITKYLDLFFENLLMNKQQNAKTKSIVLAFLYITIILTIYNSISLLFNDLLYSNFL